MSMLIWWYGCATTIHVQSGMCATYKTALITFKVRKTAFPAYLNCHLTSRVTPRTTRSSTLPLLFVPLVKLVKLVKTEFAKRSFSYAAPHIWNNFPADIVIV